MIDLLFFDCITSNTSILISVINIYPVTACEFSPRRSSKMSVICLFLSLKAVVNATVAKNVILILLDLETTQKILEFVLNSIGKVKPGFILSSMCIFSESNRTKSQSHSFHLQNSGILQTRRDQRGDPMKINFDNF